MNNLTAELIKSEQLISSLSHYSSDQEILPQANIKFYQNKGEDINSRVNGLNQAAKLRTSIFYADKNNPDNRELSGFIEYLRSQDQRLLNMIFYLAGINSQQYHLVFDKLNKQDKQSIINAINQIKALAALLPKHIAMPI